MVERNPEPRAEIEKGPADEEDTDETRSRRDLVKKTAAGMAVGGLVWTAPKVEGLSLRPDYAAAQSAVGASFDLTAGAVVETTTRAFALLYSPAPGLDRATAQFDLFLAAAPAAVWRARILGSLATNNCNIDGIDGSHNFTSLSPSSPFSGSPADASGPSSRERFLIAAGPSGGDLSGATTFTMHVTCT